MTNSAIAAIKLADLLKPTEEGEPVNVHVVESTKEPEPDFEALRRMISGAGEKQTGEMKQKTESG